MRIKAIGLDFDGTVYNSFRNGLRSAKDMFREIERPFCKRDEKTIREMWGDSLLRIVAALFPKETPARHRKLLERWLEYSREREKKSPSRLIPGTNAALKALKDMGLTVVIATNRTAEKLYEALLTAKLNLKYVDYLIAHNPSPEFAAFLAKRKAKPLMEGTPYKKPDRRYLAKLNQFLRTRGVAPQEMVFCGDALFDAYAAAAGGYNFIPVLTGPAGTTNAWWEARLADAKIPPLAIPSSIKDLPLLIRTLERSAEEQDQLNDA